MIITITPDITRLALRVKDVSNHRQLTDWRQLQLLVQPGQYDGHDCGPNGSPWFLFGCWPGKRTGVDVANYRPDFPTICYNALELDPDGRIVFLLDDRLHCLPRGRYTGILRLTPGGHTPFIPPVVKKPASAGVPLPPEYHVGNQNCSPSFEEPPCPPPPPSCCILSWFDIDLGPACSDHMVDQAAVEFSLSTCGEA